MQEDAAYAGPLSPPPELEVHPTAKDQEGEDSRRPLESAEVMEQVQPSLGSEPLVQDEALPHQQATPNLTPYHVRMREESRGSSDESENDFPSDKSAAVTTKQEEKQNPRDLNDPPTKKEEETSDSETQAVIEPHSESRTSSPVSEYEPEEEGAGLNKWVEFRREESKITGDDDTEGEMRTREADVEEPLYPDGEEMDTWDSVMEKKVDLKSGDGGSKQDQDSHQHIEPEEDISPRLQELEEKDPGQHVDAEEQRVESHPVLDAPATLGLPHYEEDEDEDLQNVSMSWRTEMEGMSDAQDNTLADTRPLIRYKSDETDANTQASHADESESSSEAEQEKKKAGELRTWAEGKTQRSGTMEDLCEEVEEEEVLDERYQLGYTHLEDRHNVLGKTEEVPGLTGEEAIQDKEEHEGSGEPAQSLAFPEPDVELDTDRLVEQELENLDTFSYSVHFAQQQVSPRELRAEEEEEDMAAELEPEDGIHQELRSSPSFVDESYGNSSFSNTLAKEPEVQPEGSGTLQKRDGEEEHNVSKVTPAAEETEGAVIRRSDLEELLVQHLQGVSIVSEAGEVALETSGEPLEHCKEDMAGKPNQDFELREHETREEGAPEPAAESPAHEEVQLLQKLPDSEPSDIFQVMDSPKVLATNGKDHDLHALFGASLKSDFWTSSLETGATYQPDKPCDEETKPVNQNLVNWSSATKTRVQEEEQEGQAGTKQVPCRKAVQGEFVHSEESDVEAESWSSGEEPI